MANYRLTDNPEWVSDPLGIAQSANDPAYLAWLSSGNTPDPYVRPVFENSWGQLFESLSSSTLFARVSTVGATSLLVFSQLSFLITLITATKRVDQLQGRLNVLASGLAAAGSPLTASEKLYLNTVLSESGFSATVN